MTLLTATAHTAHSGHGTGPLTLTLLALSLLAGYAISLYLWPSRPCPRCGGTRLHRGSTSHRFSLCTRCAGTGRTRRPGATTIHRAYWSIASDQHREHHRRHARQAHQDASHPKP
jgi:hypothetical protein